MSTVVLVVGEGVLAEYVNRHLSAEYKIIRQADFNAGVPLETDLALVLHDGWNPSEHQKAEDVFRRSGIPWLRGFVSFGEGVVGPLVFPDTPGCTYCADTRRLLAGRDRKEMWEIEQRLSVKEGIAFDPWASRTGLLHMSHLLCSEAHRVLEGGLVHSNGRVSLINLKTLESSQHFILPNSLCPYCSHVPDDSPELARIILKPSLKTSIDSYRSKSMEDLSKVLAKEYLDQRTGFLNGKMHDFSLPFADVIVNLPLLTEDEGVAGRSHSYAVSELTAILEGLERHCGLSPRGKRTVIHDSYHNLADHALNPVKVGVHEINQYRRPDFQFKEFKPDLPINWVWGYSFLEERPILVPQLLAYYSLGNGFVYETSNGCALGGSLEEAIFYGILEVLERDSFLMTWYAQLPLPRLDPHSSNDQELELMVQRVREVAGYDLHFFNSTMEHNIPSIFAIAKNRKQKGLNVICAAGAHLDPVRAVKSAIHELAGMMLIHDEKFEADRDRYVQMYHDSSLVLTMDDHGMLYGLPEAEERFEFLLDDNRPLRTFEEEFRLIPGHADLTGDLEYILKEFRKFNLDVIVVDQTSSETIRNGLHCVKVLIPGMLPMTFGHHLSRLTGLERVLRVPMELGYKKQPLNLEQLNPYPHPFP